MIWTGYNACETDGKRRVTEKPNGGLCSLQQRPKGANERHFLDQDLCCRYESDGRFSARASLLASYLLLGMFVLRPKYALAQCLWLTCVVVYCNDSNGRRGSRFSNEAISVLPSHLSSRLACHPSCDLHSHGMEGLIYLDWCLVFVTLFKQWSGVQPLLITPG